jgi:HEPN domain-containing protein
MSERPEVLEVARDWVRKAEEDLTNAEYVLTLKEHCPLGTVCFHCQQCAEKYLKALLTCRAVAYPRTHDLARLAGLLPEEDGRVLAREEAGSLTRYNVEGRYPGDWNPPTRDEAEKAVAIARKLREAIRGRLPQEACDD